MPTHQRTHAFVAVLALVAFLSHALPALGTTPTSKGHGKKFGKGKSTSSSAPRNATLPLPSSSVGSFARFEDLLSRTWLPEHVFSPKRKWTLFAPVDAAFDDVPENIQAQITEDPHLLFKVVATHAVRNRRVPYDALAAGNMSKLKTRSGAHLRVATAVDGAVTVQAQSGPAATVLAESSERVGGALVHPVTALLIPEYVRKRLDQAGADSETAACGALGQGCCQGGGCSTRSTFCDPTTDTCAACGSAYQPCCPSSASANATCHQQPLATISVVSGIYADGLANYTTTNQVLACNSVNNTCLPCGQLGGPCCPPIAGTPASQAASEEDPNQDVFGKCASVGGDDAVPVCSEPVCYASQCPADAQSAGICKLLDDALVDGDLWYTTTNNGGTPASYGWCGQSVFLDADLRAFLFWGDCTTDFDSTIELPDALYEEYGDDDSALEAAAQKLLPRPSPLPPLPSFEGCLPESTGTFEGAFDFNASNFIGIAFEDQPCVRADVVEYANVTLVDGGFDANSIVVLGYPDAPGQGGFQCTAVEEYLCNLDGLLPDDPAYPAMRPYCDITAPFGLSYKARNGTIVPLLYQATEYGTLLSCSAGAFAAYGSRVNARSRRCRRACKRCGYRCRRCGRCSRRGRRG